MGAKVIFLMGPTASGKTDLAVDMVQRWPVDIISVDSALVYRGMDIGTAKPDQETLAQAPHALIDIREPTESYSAAEFCQDAMREIEASHAQGRIPLLVGGTMLYFNALANGLADLPAADADIRSRIEQQAAQQGWQAMHQKLSKLDPVIAERIHPNDPQRISRALEVIEIAGRPMSELQEQARGAGIAADECFDILRIIACPQPRAVLHQRIEQRFEQMMKQGFMREMTGLFQRGDLDPSMPSMRCVGYRQAWEHLEGKTTAEEMRLKAIYATRQLAKRQLTWLRREQAAIWYDPTNGNGLESITTKVGTFLEFQTDRTNDKARPG